MTGLVVVRFGLWIGDLRNAVARRLLIVGCVKIQSSRSSKLERGTSRVGHLQCRVSDRFLLNVERDGPVVVYTKERDEKDDCRTAELLHGAARNVTVSKVLCSRASDAVGVRLTSRCRSELGPQSVLDVAT